jgi:hypothetical protein
MEDILLIQQDLNVSHNYNLSLFAVFDGFLLLKIFYELIL